MNRELKERLRLTIMLVIIVVGMALLVYFSTRPPKGHYNVGGGSVSITAEYSGSKIVVDSIIEHTTSNDNEVYTDTSLAEKPYQFAVSRESYWPWAKTVTPKPGEKITLNSFSIRMNPELSIIGKSSEEYAIYRSKFDSLKTPSESSKLISQDGKVAIWAEGGQIFASWLRDASSTPAFLCQNGECNYRETVVSLIHNVRSLAFLENRNDVILFSDDEGVYAIELDKNGLQNFQPIYKAPIAEFIMEAPRTMVIESRGDMVRVNF